MDFVDVYGQSLRDFVARVRQVDDAQWDAPTPCSEWTVRQLVNHVVYEGRWAVPLFGGATIAEVGDRFEGDLLGDDPAGAAESAAEGADAVIREPGALDRTVQLSFGATPGLEYAAQLFTDHLIHGWDLAVAIGADPTLDAEAVRQCADWFVENEAGYRQAGAVGPRVEVGEDASAQDRLLAAFGRDPDWKP